MKDITDAIFALDLWLLIRILKASVSSQLMGIHAHSECIPWADDTSLSSVALIHPFRRLWDTLPTAEQQPPPW